MHASEWSQEVTQRRPQPFDGVGMNFTHSISIRISRPLVCAMTDRLMSACDAVVALPFVGVAGRLRQRRAMHVLRQGCSIRALANSQTTLATLSADSAHYRRAIIGVGAVSTPLIRPAARRITRVGMEFAFFPPRSGTSRPSPSPHLSGKSRSTSHMHSPGGACATYEHSRARPPVQWQATHSTRLCRCHATAARRGAHPDCFRQRWFRYTNYKRARTADTANQRSRACRACETAARAELWQRTAGTVSHVGENVSRPKRYSLLHLTTRLSGKSFPKLITHQLFT